jgi:hypothetical protein
MADKYKKFQLKHCIEYAKFLPKIKEMTSKMLTILKKNWILKYKFTIQNLVRFTEEQRNMLKYTYRCLETTVHPLPASRQSVDSHVLR